MGAFNPQQRYDDLLAALLAIIELLDASELKSNSVFAELSYELDTLAAQLSEDNTAEICAQFYAEDAQDHNVSHRENPLVLPKQGALLMAQGMN